MSDADHNCGIYRITDTTSGRVYIGSACNLRRRLYLHRWSLRRGEHHSYLLQRAWNKNGDSAFRFDVVLICSRENLLFYEQALIDFYDSTDHAKGMNIAAPSRPVARTTQSLAKWRAKMKGRRMAPAHYKAFLRTVKRGDEHFFFGRQHSPESRAKISAKLKGRAAPNKGKQSPFRGVPRTADVKARIAAAKRASPQAVLSIPIVRALREDHAKGASVTTLMKKHGQTYWRVWRVVNNKIWRDV